MSSQSLPARPGRQPDTAAFSYTCHRCRRCCYDKLIQVNPYEIARLARNRGVSTSAFIATYLDTKPYLQRQADGACVFLGPEGCGVHVDRPLVCRVYPLGRHIRSDGRVEYSQLEGHPESAGIFGHEGTIADYLADQKIDDFVRGSDLYFNQLQRLFDAWREAPEVAASADETEMASAEGAADDPMPDFLDADKAIADYCARNSQPEPTDLEARMQLHLAAIEQWLQRQKDR
jgi:uncharacterized protein